MYGWMDILTSKYVGGSFVIQSIETVITLTNRFRIKSGEDFFWSADICNMQ